MKVQEAVIKGNEILKSKGTKDALIKTRILLANILKCSKEKLIIMSNENMNMQNEQDFFSGIENLSYRLSYSVFNKK